MPFVSIGFPAKKIVRLTKQLVTKKQPGWLARTPSGPSALSGCNCSRYLILVVWEVPELLPHPAAFQYLFTATSCCVTEERLPGWFAPRYFAVVQWLEPSHAAYSAASTPSPPTPQKPFPVVPLGFVA